MHNYKNIEQNFKNADNYESEAIVQNKTRSKMLNGIRNIHKKDYKKVMNIGVRNSKEISQICAFLGIRSIDILDICIPNDSKKHPNVNEYFNLNFDHDMDLINDNSYDMVISNMSLQWSSNFDKLIKNISDKLFDTGTLAFSILLEDNFTEIHDILRINKMYSAEYIIQCLSNNGLENVVVNQHKETIKFDNFKSMVIHLKNTGVTTYTGTKGFTNYNLVKTNLKSKKMFELTYHVGIFICTKAKI